MKKFLFAAALVAALAVSATAADKKPAASQHLAGDSEPGPLSQPGPPPALCSPCLFYGGDFSVNDLNAAALSDEDTLFVFGSSTYAAYIPASGVTAKVTGILFNIQASANFDPRSASYDIRTGISEGNGGTSIASGTVSTRVAATGRNFLGQNEYTILVSLSAPIYLTGGMEYWFNLTPQCANGATDGSCYLGRMYLSNTTQNSNGLYAGAQPAGNLFLNSSFLGFTWTNWCDVGLGLNSYQCRAGSFGLTGTARHD